MSLGLHLFIHIFFGLLAGVIVWRIWQKPLASFIGGLLGGVVVDFDHFIDYFMAFGPHFRLDYFEAGYQFSKSNKLYIIFHSWEYVIILAIVALVLKNKTWKTLTLSVALGLFFHLSADVAIDRLPISSYSIMNRAENHFQLDKLDPRNMDQTLRYRQIMDTTHL